MAGGAPNIIDPDLLTGPATDDEDARISDLTWWDSVKEILPALGTGVQLNAESYAGAPGDIESLYRAGRRLSDKWGGATPEELAAQRKADAAAQTMPTTEDVHQGVTQLAANMPAVVSAESGLGAYRAAMEPVEPWQPKTGLGKGIQTITSMIGPGAIRHLTRDVVMPLIGSEVGAVAGAQLGPEEEQLLSAGGGLAGGPIDEGAKQVTTRVLRGPTDPEAATTMRTLQGVDAPLTPEMPNERNERMRRLQAEGIEPTGGQALGSNLVKRVESGPFAGRAAAVNDAQARQITRAVLRRVGINADTASPEVMAAAQAEFGRQYETLVQQSNGVTFDPTLQNELVRIGTEFEDLKGTAVGTPVQRFFDRIINAQTQYGGVIPPEVFNVIHSEIASVIRRTNGIPEHSTLNASLREMQDALYETIGRNGQQGIENAARDLNNRYRNFKIVEKSVGGAGEGASFGLVSPAKLRAELERRDAVGYAQGRGDLTQLARDLQSLIPLEVTGTGAQLATSSLPELVKSMSIALPSVPLNTRRVQTSIVNRARGEHPGFFDPLPIVGQGPPILGMSQRNLSEPVPVEIPPQEDEKQSMLGNDYPVPVDLVDPADVLARRGLRYGRV